MIPYLSDESRRVGNAEEIFFPQTPEDIRRILLTDTDGPVTVQGARTGVTAGAVPDGGVAINLSSMDRVLRLPDAPDTEGASAVTVQPGLLLCRLREHLQRQRLMFAPDPTETTASIGGMVSCNSSGARSYRYGATRDHVLGLRMVLSDGDSLSIHRGEHFAKAGRFCLTTDGGRKISAALPPIRMPEVRKHTAGYYIKPDMDLIDLFIGSEGTLGIVTEIELSVFPQPAQLFGMIQFFASETDALRFVTLLRKARAAADSRSEADLPSPEAIEFFGADTLVMLRDAQREGSALTDLPAIPAGCAVYTEFAADSRGTSESLCNWLSDLIRQAGEDPARSWFAFRGPDMDRLKAFRHAAPVCVNERISSIRRSLPGITKLGTDMSVPDSCLERVFAMYRTDLVKEGFQTSLFGHIGNNHLHCNIIPRTEEEYRRGKELYERWAEEIVRMGGSVSAEHGIGKLKTWLLQKLYTKEELQAMLELKRSFDPMLRLNPGNIFDRSVT